MPNGPVRFVPIWKTAPFLRLVVPLIIGILIGYYFPTLHLFWLPVTCVLALFYLVAHFRALQYPVVYGIILFCLWVSAGAALFTNNQIESKPYFIGNTYKPGSVINATITSMPELKPNSIRAEARVRQWDSVTNTWTLLAGKIILYFEKDSVLPQYQPGTNIAFTKSLQPIRNSGNPGAFKYKEYAASNDWFYQVYLKKGECLIATEKENPGWRIWPMKARENLLTTLRKYIPDKRTLGVAEALLTGYRNDMDKELNWQYAGTGVAHIIAISGLHLGMIQVALLALFAPLKRIKYGRQLVPLLVIGCLWVFALVTGAGPSVLRSALMFTILLFGEVIERKGNSYNSLSASAFILLLFNPNLIFNVGFQLSYSAVLSIFIFSAPIGQWIKTKSKWVNKGWQMLSVTLAAQILTLPFVVYYFNQFPTYFLLANLVALPLSWLALNLLLLLTLVFWWLGPVSKILGSLIHFTIATMNDFIGWIHQLPMARIENIYLSLPQATAMMGVIALVSAWLLLRHKTSAVLALAGLLAFILHREWEWNRQFSRKKLIVYHINRHSAIDMVNGHSAIFWGDMACLEDPLIFRNNILPARILNQVSQSGFIEKDTTGFQMLKVGGKKVLILDKDIDTRRSDKMKVDILILAENIRAKPQWILEKIQCNTIVADAKLPFYRLAQWQIAADSLHLPFHSVAEKGAYQLDF
jgi:competence protein ComEC